ncbi:MAG: hypothetical protein LQ337_005157 [Flavoplaca oasis]|nr:MAG: hypothetical protein LQ337_005157 [Flavoplaca oasis]
MLLGSRVFGRLLHPTKAPTRMKTARAAWQISTDQSDGDSETYVKSELGDRIRTHDEKSGQCVRAEQDEETGRNKVHDGEVLDNNVLDIHRVTETVVVVLVLCRVIGADHASIRLLD